MWSLLIEEICDVCTHLRGIEFCRAQLYNIGTTCPKFRHIKLVTSCEVYHMYISFFDTHCAFFHIVTAQEL